MDTPTTADAQSSVPVDMSNRVKKEAVACPSLDSEAAADTAPSHRLSLLAQLSLGLENTYAQCGVPPTKAAASPALQDETTATPTARRILTKKANPLGNGGLDNEDRNLIVRVRDVLGGESPSQPSYVVLDMLGQGTFGQVFRCQNTRSKEIVAVKVIRNHPSYYKQAIVEVQITSMLNRTYSAEAAPHIVRLQGTFEFQNHLCLVFELLSMNVYELIAENNFTGFPLEVTRGLLQQIVHALVQLEQIGVIHCDLKPENILLVGQDRFLSDLDDSRSTDRDVFATAARTTPLIKVVDFGSACLENETVYSYIQSRFYRSPEVLLGIPYNGAIDMWSLGCIAVEMFLGLPLFPGVSEHDQLRLIEETLGPLPQSVLRRGRNVLKYYRLRDGQREFELKTPEEYAADTHTDIQQSKKYFKYSKLSEMIYAYPVDERASLAEQQFDRERREAFLDFVNGLLCLDPDMRWTAHDAMRHPFMTGMPFHHSYVPIAAPVAPLPIAMVVKSEHEHASPYGNPYYSTTSYPLWQQHESIWSPQSSYLYDRRYADAQPDVHIPYPSPTKLNAKVTPQSESDEGSTRRYESAEYAQGHNTYISAIESPLSLPPPQQSSYHSKVIPTRSTHSVVPLPPYYLNEPLDPLPTARSSSYYNPMEGCHLDWSWGNEEFQYRPQGTTFVAPPSTYVTSYPDDANRHRHASKRQSVRRNSGWDEHPSGLSEPHRHHYHHHYHDRGRDDQVNVHGARKSRGNGAPRRIETKGSEYHAPPMGGSQTHRHARLRKSPKSVPVKQRGRHGHDRYEVTPHGITGSGGRGGNSGRRQHHIPHTRDESTVCAVEEKFSAAISLEVAAVASSLSLLPPT